MSDEDKNDVVEGAEDTPSQDDVAAKEAADEESKQSTISKISDILSGRKADVEDDVDEDEPEESPEPDKSDDEAEPAGEDADDEPGDVIDPRFVAAARAYGWDDTRIQEYASNHDDRDLVMLTGMMERNTPSEVDDDDVIDFEEEPKEVSPVDAVLKVLEDSQDIGDPAKNMIKSLASHIQAQDQKLADMDRRYNEVTASQQQNQWLDNYQVANEVFDKAAEKLSEIGKTSDITLPDGSLNPNESAVEVREHLFDMAIMFHENGRPWRQSVEDSIRWYRGGREDAAEASVLRKIKANEKRLSPNRGTRQAPTKKYVNEEERKADVVNSVLRKYGTEVPE
jgi:hypothetical protein